MGDAIGRVDRVNVIPARNSCHTVFGNQIIHVERLNIIFGKNVAEFKVAPQYIAPGTEVFFILGVHVGRADIKDNAVGGIFL